MDQNQRNKIAWILCVILAPIFIYTLSTNVFKATKRRPVPPPSQAPATVKSADGGSSAVTPPPPALPTPVRPQAPEIAHNVAVKQQEIAAHLPQRNPFSASPQMTAPAAASGPAVNPARAATTAIQVTGIVSRPGLRNIAIINGKLLGEGDRIGEWTILKVNPQNVLLDNGVRQMVIGVK